MTSEPLFVEERRRAIVERLRQRGRVTVNELREAMQVSAVTIRQDLRALEESGWLERTYGGAVLKTGGFTPSELSFHVRQKRHKREKDAIGAVAAALVHEGDAIGLDGSTTAFALVAYLKQFDRITVVTNSLIMAQGFLDAPHVQVLMPGGRLRRDSVALVGRPDDIPSIHLTIGFFGTGGITVDHGATETDPDEVAMKQALTRQCLSVVIVADASKWGRIAPYTFVPLERIQRIITDEAAPAESIEQFEARGIPVDRATI